MVAVRPDVAALVRAFDEDGAQLDEVFGAGRAQEWFDDDERVEWDKRLQML